MAGLGSLALQAVLYAALSFVGGLFVGIALRFILKIVAIIGGVLFAVIAADILNLINLGIDWNKLLKSFFDAIGLKSFISEIVSKMESFASGASFGPVATLPPIFLVLAVPFIAGFFKGLSG